MRPDQTKSIPDIHNPTSLQIVNCLWGLISHYLGRPYSQAVHHPQQTTNNPNVSHKIKKCKWHCKFTYLQTAIIITESDGWHKQWHLTWTKAPSCSLRSSHQTLWTSSGCRRGSSHTSQRWCSEQLPASPISKLKTEEKKREQERGDVK